jgi:4-diphosphocytidyl-2-C-methyl-D-erythritol kinase
MIHELRNLPAPAKLNLVLHVTGRRTDGYHLLETVFQLIELGDRIHLKRRDDGTVLLERPLPGVPPEADLTVRAARLLARQTGCSLGVSIALDKRIPIGGGLGGGSSDAATVLLGLVRLWDLSISRADLMRIALSLGADVPFFIFGQTAYATGVGERLRACPQPNRHFVLLAPPVSVATAAVFSSSGLTRNTKPITIAGLSRGGRVFLGRNDLEPTVIASHPEVGAAISRLVTAADSAGVSPLRVRMSGSGSTVFLPVDNASQAHRIVQRLQSGAVPGPDRSWSVRSLAMHPLRDWAFSARRSHGSG